jgi:hypothetical protein
MRLKLVLIVILYLLSGCSPFDPLEPPTPPLLVNVTAGSGWWGACPPKDDKEAKMIQMAGKLALSPELEQRLLSEFPPGSNESRIVDALTKQGFKMFPPCKTDQSIHGAEFVQHGGGAFTYQIMASIYWKVDETNAIVWTKGFVAYHGL